VKGQKIGFVSVNPLYDGWAVKKWLQAGYDYLKDQGCAVVVACMHYGGDKTPVIETEQIALYHQVIDMGYDLVVGNHPHVLQAIEIYKGRYIAYSLGNFSYGGNKNPADKDSGIFRQTFTFLDGVLQSTINAQFIPCHLSGKTDKNNYRPTPASGEEFDRIIQKVNSYSDPFGFAWDENGLFILP
jgi:poly-gamma-glutamate synthesis protein (capsule biosynthesis protein)